MKAIFLALSLAALPAYATTLGLLTVKMPVYLHGADEDAVIQIMDIPVTNGSSTNEAKYGGICHAFVPPNLSSWVKPANINIAHEYGIHAMMEERQENGTHQWIITVDASSAQRPEGYPFTIEQVTDAVMTCARLMTPAVPEEERKVTFKLLPPKTSQSEAAGWSEDRLAKENELFAASIAGTTWEKVGNFQVQRIRFDGAKLCALDYQNRPATTWDKTHIHEPYRLHVDYSDGTSSWYFLDKDHLDLINCKVSRWVEYRAEDDGWKTAAAGEFPALRLKDDSIEIDQGHDKPAATLPCIQVGSRLSEFTLPDGRLFWAFTSVTHRRLWLLQVRNVFGGRVCGTQRITQVRSTLPAVLPEREKRLVDFIYQLREAEKWPAADTLSRELIRRSADRNEAQQDYMRALLGYATQTKRGLPKELP